jgi:HSP20 family protein
MEFKDLMPWNWPRAGMGAAPEGPEALKALQADINRAFESFWQSFPHRFRAGFGVSIEPHAMAIDLAERGDVIEITADVPGCREEDIEVSAGPDVIEIKAERAPRAEEARGGYLVRERLPSVMRRLIALPVPIREDGIEASCRDGVLTIRAARSGETRPLGKRIEVAKG